MGIAGTQISVDLERFAIDRGRIFIWAFLHGTSAPVRHLYGPYRSQKAAEALAERVRATEAYRRVVVHVYDKPRSHTWRGEPRSPRR